MPVIWTAPPPPPVLLPPPPAPTYADPALYRYIDDADALLDTVGTSPPDYGFRFDGVNGWAWELSGGALVLAEPVGDHFRFYAFAGSDPYPFFVGDDAYSYGFAGRALAAVYGDEGQLIGWSPTDVIANGAAWLAERGRAMRASLRTRVPVVASDWADSLWYFSDLELRFDTWRGQPGWSDYRTGPGSRHRRDWRARLGGEGDQRRDRADRFDRWRRDGYRGSPPASEGGWNTTRPGASGWSGNSGKGGWTGRLRPSTPPSSGVTPPPPRADRPDDRRPRRGEPGRWPGRGQVDGATPPAVLPPRGPAPQPGRPPRPARDNDQGTAPPPPPIDVVPPPQPVDVVPPDADRPTDARPPRAPRLPGVDPSDRPRPRPIGRVDAEPRADAPVGGEMRRAVPPAPLPKPVYVPPPPERVEASPPQQIAPPPAPPPVYVTPPAPPVDVAPPPPPPPPPVAQPEARELSAPIKAEE